MVAVRSILGLSASFFWSPSDCWNLHLVLAGKGVLNSELSSLVKEYPKGTRMHGVLEEPHRLRLIPGDLTK